MGEALALPGRSRDSSRIGFGKGALSKLLCCCLAVLQLQNKVQAKVEAEAKDEDRG